jgi:hypothetical protein
VLQEGVGDAVHGQSEEQDAGGARGGVDQGVNEWRKARARWEKAELSERAVS